MAKRIPWQTIENLIVCAPTGAHLIMARDDRARKASILTTRNNRLDIVVIDYDAFTRVEYEYRSVDLILDPLIKLATKDKAILSNRFPQYSRLAEVACGVQW